MACNFWTFIIVPDARSQCKRYRMPNVVLYIFVVTGAVLLVALGILINTMFGEYKAVSTKAEQVEKFKKISLSQKSTIDRYEEDIVQLGKNLAQIKQLNSRLMILTGLDPEKGGNNLGLGGPEKGSSKLKVQDEKNGQQE